MITLEQQHALAEGHIDFEQEFRMIPWSGTPWMLVHQKDQFGGLTTIWPDGEVWTS